MQPDGKIVVAGWGERGGAQGFGLARYTQTGALDTSFGFHGKAVTLIGGRSVAWAEAEQPDGKIVAAGAAGPKLELARYTAGGKLDQTFGKAGTVASRPVAAFAVAVRPDGDLVVGGIGATSGIVGLFHQNGSIDSAFGTGGWTSLQADNAAAVAVLTDGKIVVVGPSLAGGVPCFSLTRLLADGSPDASFGAGGTEKTCFSSQPAYPGALSLQSDGKIVVAGSVRTDAIGPGYEFAVARYLADGSLDPDFGSGGVVMTPFGNVTGADLPYGAGAGAVAIQQDGKIVAGGTELVPWPGRGAFALARYNADGSLDSSFGDGGKVTTSFGYAPPENPTEDGDGISDLAIQPDGRIVAGGASQFGPHTEQYAVAVARYLGDGSLDPSFGTGGLVKTSLALCVVPKLKGMKMDWFAQQRIKGSHCAVGKIKRVHSRHVKRRHIISERPRPGTVHVEGTKVWVVVSSGRR